MENPGVDGEKISKWILGKWVGGARIRSIWLRTGTGGELL